MVFQQIAVPRRLPSYAVLLKLVSFCNVCAGLSSFPASDVTVRGQDIGLRSGMGDSIWRLKGWRVLRLRVWQTSGDFSYR